MKPIVRKEDSLHQLIKSMHKGEKRFFAAYCSHYGSSKEKIYLQLFRAMDKQKYYDEKALKKKFSGKSSEGHLHVIKNYLQNLILDSLYMYRSRNNRSLRTKFFRAETYFEKGLYEQAQQILQKLRKEAEEEEDFITLFECLRLEKRLMLTLANVNEDRMKILAEKENSGLQSYREICDYMNLGMEVGYIHFKYHESSLNIKDIEKREIDKRRIFTDTYAPQSTYGRYLLHNARGTYYRTVSEFKKASEECKLALDAIENNEVFKESHAETMLAALLNYVTSILIIKDYKKALETMTGLHNFITRNMAKFRENILVKYFNMEQRVSMLVGEKEDAVKLLENLEKYIDEHNSIPDTEKVVFYFNAVDMHFFYGDYSKSLQWLNKAMNFNADRVNSTLYRYLRIIQVILLFEMKEYELMEYRLRSLYRYLLRQSALMKFEKVFMGFFREVLKRPGINNNHVPGLLGSLKKSLPEVFEDRNEAVVLQYFDILSWIDSKIQNRPLSEIIREKAGIPQAVYYKKPV